ncbi:50S ribosomal protein L17 [Acholeplasma equifetale]|jgi:large subunit ribosomal protein L17|uniref:50S ribosomal protein L17 n=1 Tax=Acholeplasma equifetale TaxID=264634 RepID=UPI0004787950|nr:50S ribosomal protein L17 [Acholeplasma equifetale]HHY96717.1 50S ribosomal protein L17 [Acholeplasma sp.]
MATPSKLRRTTDQRKALLRDLITDLIINDRIMTTEAKAKSLQRLADEMVTLAKENTLASRRKAAQTVRFEEVKDGQNALQKLFNEIAPRYADRNGGYTRIIKTVPRRGDAAPMAIIEFI